MILSDLGAARESEQGRDISLLSREAGSICSLSPVEVGGMPRGQPARSSAHRTVSTQASHRWEGRMTYDRDGQGHNVSIYGDDTVHKIASLCGAGDLGLSWDTS